MKPSQRRARRASVSRLLGTDHPGGIAQTGVTTRVPVAAGRPANTTADGGRSGFATISADGRFVAFESSASNLAAADTNGRPDVFVRDRELGTTTRVSVATGGVQA